MKHSSGIRAVRGAAITIRPAYAEDQSALFRLAALDSAPPVCSPILIAEVDGELRAALSLHDGTVIADPFFPTVHLVDLLSSHAAVTARKAPVRAGYRPKFA